MSKQMQTNTENIDNKSARKKMADRFYLLQKAFSGCFAHTSLGLCTAKAEPYLLWTVFTVCVCVCVCVHD